MQIAASHLLRTALRSGVLIVIGFAMMETWFLDGLVAPYRVHGGSMAGALLGVHRDVVCSDCGYCFSCDSNAASPPARAVCPNCGYARNDLQSTSDVAGDRVLIDRDAFTIRAPRRWEVVALRSTSPPERLIVKRVVGLPGESIDIRHGDVYVNGEIARKDLFAQRALAIMVYDSQFVPTQRPRPPARWRPERTDTGWNADRGVFHHILNRNGQSADWLVYHHWHRLPSASAEQKEGTSPSSQFRESPVTDLCGYNQSRPRREEDVHAVTDLLVSLRVHCSSGGGQFVIRLTDGDQGFEGRLRFIDGRLAGCETVGLKSIPGAAITSLKTNEPAAASRDVPAGHGERLVEASLVDQQFLLAIDGQTVATVPYERAEPVPPSSCPVAIAADGADVTVRNLRLYRDVYYTEPPPLSDGERRPSRTNVGRNEYFVLGDNSAVSEDSRTWPRPGVVDAKLLLGKPLVAIPSAALWPWHGGHFQVPNLLAIRYIH